MKVNKTGILSKDAVFIYIPSLSSMGVNVDAEVLVYTSAQNEAGSRVRTSPSGEVKVKTPFSTLCFSDNEILARSYLPLSDAISKLIKILPV